MDKIFDIKYARKLARGHDLKVKLRKSKRKGIGLYAKKPIKKGNVIAYYKFKVYDYSHDQVKGGRYGMYVYTKSGRESRNKMGDIYPGSLAPPKRGIPYWAYFSNEPAKSLNQKQNAYLDVNLKQNYRHRFRIRTGDTLVYKLRASRNIDKGEEIVWCYGDEYDRDYVANCDI